MANQDTPIHAVRDLASGIGRSDRQHHPGMVVPQAVRYAGEKMVEKPINNKKRGSGKVLGVFFIS